MKCTTRQLVRYARCWNGESSFALNAPRACDVQAKEVQGKVNRNKLKTNNT